MFSKVTHIFLFCCVIIYTVDLKAQKLISGRVEDAMSTLPLSGVKVFIKGTTKSTTTNSQGNYSIFSNEFDVLTFEKKNYKLVKMGLYQQNIINVKLYSTTNNFISNSSILSFDGIDDSYKFTVIGKAHISDSSNNTSIGSNAGLQTNSSKSINIGKNAGAYNYGTESINIGFEAGENNSSWNSINIGDLAGKNSEFSRNVNIGSSAGHNNLGFGNINIGYESGQWNTSDNSIHLGINAGANNTSDCAVAIGVGAGQFNVLGNKLVALGYFAARNNAAQNVIAIGEQAAENNTGNFGIFQGYTVGLNNSGAQAIGIGYGNLKANSGFGNTAIGFVAGYQNTTGSRNTFLGTESGLTNTVGDNNTYLGWRAGFLHETGTGNTLVGESANDQAKGGDDNTAIGREAFHDNFTGSRNVSIGSYSMYGAQNILARDMVAGNLYSIKDRGLPQINFMDYGASNNLVWTDFIYNGDTITSENAIVRDPNFEPVENIAIGYQSGKAVGAGSGNIFIGANVGSDLTQHGKSNKLMIDNKNTLTPLIGGDFNTQELEIGGKVKLTVRFPPDGTGVFNGSIFYGTDGALYFKGGSGTITKLADN
jgi:trimeric autotransporter adhesin